MIAQILETKIGNFWLEANGLPIHFQLEDKIEYLDQFEFESMGDSKVDFAVTIRPVTPVSKRQIKKLFLCSDIPKEDWWSDEFTTGEGVICHNLIDNERKASLSLGISSYDEYSRYEAKNFRKKLDNTYPLYLIDDGWESSSGMDTLAMGDSEMNREAISVVEFAIAIKFFGEARKVNTTATDISVFYML